MIPKKEIGESKAMCSKKQFKISSIGFLKMLYRNSIVGHRK